MKIVASIDLMGGEAVQLVNGDPAQLKVRDGNVLELAEKFSSLGVINVIDLDAALGQGNNRLLIQQLAARYRINVGGGIRTVEDAQSTVEAGAEKVILGTPLYSETGIDKEFIQKLEQTVGAEKLVFAVDCKGRVVCSRGWRESTGLNIFDLVEELGSSCSELLFTSVNQEGTMKGPDLASIEQLVAVSPVPILAAGGIGSMKDIKAVRSLGASVVLGMCLYTGRVSVDALQKLLTNEQR